MSKDHLPGANRTAQYWAGKFVGSKMETNCACLHTTEGFTWPGYAGGATAPHLTLLPNISTRSVSTRQHFPASRSSRALVNLTGGVETNTLNVLQIELVGTCDSAHRKTWAGKVAGVDYIYWPDAPDWLLLEVAKVLQWLDAEWEKFQLVDAAPRGWLAYGPDPRRPGVSPASYGNSPARMTFAEWRNAYGIFGHQHVPENAHGDPGAFPIDRLVLLATCGVVAPAPDPAPDPVPVVYDRMDPTSYGPGKNGDHVTWYGGRVALWSTALGLPNPYSVGPGPNWGPADEAGTRRIQLDRWPSASTAPGGDADGLPGRQTLDMVAGDPPVKVVPIEVTSQWRNVAGYNAPDRPGVTKYREHVPNIAAEIKSVAPDVVNFQELSADAPDMRPLMDTELGDGWDRAPRGSDGRYIYRRKATTNLIASGKFEAAPDTLLNRDDKQAAWIAYGLDGHRGVRAMDVSAHTENQDGKNTRGGVIGRDADHLRVDQAMSFLDQALAKARELVIPVENIAIGGDWNSPGWVVDAFAARGWVSIGDGRPTFSGWTNRRTKRVDHVFVKAGVTASGRTIESSDQDHDTIQVTRWLVN